MLRQPVALAFDDLLPPFSDDPHPEQREQQARLTLWKRAARKSSRRNGPKPICLSEGQMVLLRCQQDTVTREGLFAKFFLLYEGPYVVERVIGPNVYQLRDSEGNQIGTFNLRHLKPYHINVGIPTDATCLQLSCSSPVPASPEGKEKPAEMGATKEESWSTCPAGPRIHPRPSGPPGTKACASGDPSQPSAATQRSGTKGSCPAAEGLNLDTATFSAAPGYSTDATSSAIGPTQATTINCEKGPSPSATASCATLPGTPS